MNLQHLCRNCDQQTNKLLKLPSPEAPISEVCENCFNAACNAEIEIAQKRPLEGETNADWVKRCHAVSEKYGFADDVHKYCQECGQPRIHDPICIECHNADECAEADAPMRFEHAIDVLIKVQEAVSCQSDDIQDAIDNLYAIRETCPKK